jgi:hypothetical protein
MAEINDELLNALRDLENAQPNEHYRPLAFDEDKFNNMPDGLQQGDSGQLLEARSQSCQDFADELDAAISEIRDAWQPFADDEKQENEAPNADRDKALEECQNIVSNLSWSYE